MSALDSALHRWRHKMAGVDRLSMAVFLFGGPFLLWWELCLVAGFNHTEWSPAYTLHCLLAVFFAVNMYGNWFMTFATDVSGKSVVFPSGSTPPDWRLCEVCVSNVPPRSYHCPLCKVCVLKRDHHCWFAGNCIGHGNHRYFLALCVHMAVLGIYCNVYNWSFVWSVKGEVTLYNVFSFILPHLTAVLGYETWYTFVITTFSMIGFAMAVLYVWLLEIQVMQVIKGQTRYERKKGVERYGGGTLWANVEEVLGRRTFLVLLWPWLDSPLPGDGVTFTLSQSESHKDS